MEGRKLNVLVGCTGSVATIKLPLILELLEKKGCFQTKVCLTDKALHFCGVDEIKHLTEVFTDEREWSSWKTRGDPVLHIELTKWADLFVIAPLDANSLGKISSGICDNMLLCLVRAWDVKKPMLFCPAMNTMMWHHPITSSQVSLLKSWGYVEMPCISKTLMCGDTGLGAMAEPVDIVDKIVELSKSITIKSDCS